MRVSGLQGLRNSRQSRKLEKQTMRMNLRTNFPAAAAQVEGLGRRGPIVAAIALTRTGKDVQGALRAEKETVFDKPTRYTLNGTFLKPATRERLEARVWVKDYRTGGTPAERFLGPEIFGGARGQKGLELMLQAHGLMPTGWFAVPGEGAELDGNGNVRRGQIRQILSQLKVQRTGGHESRATGSQRSNRTIARQGVTYFALPNGNRGLPPGVYMKRKFAHGSAIRPVFVFVSQAQYQQRLRFHEVGQATIDSRFPFHWETEFNRPRPGAGGG